MYTTYHSSTRATFPAKEIFDRSREIDKFIDVIIRRECLVDEFLLLFILTASSRLLLFFQLILLEVTDSLELSLYRTGREKTKTLSHLTLLIVLFFVLSTTSGCHFSLSSVHSQEEKKGRIIQRVRDTSFDVVVVHSVYRIENDKGLFERTRD